MSSAVVQLLELRDPLRVARDRAARRAADHRRVVARIVVLAEQLAHFELDEVEQLGVLDEVALVEEHDDLRHVHLTGEQDVLARLRHRAVDRAHHEDRAVHLRGTRDHVLHVVGVARAVDVRVVAVRRLVLHVRPSRSSGSSSHRDGPATPTPSRLRRTRCTWCRSPCRPTPWSAPRSGSFCRGRRGRSCRRSRAAWSARTLPLPLYRSWLVESLYGAGLLGQTGDWMLPHSTDSSTSTCPTTFTLLMISSALLFGTSS